MGSASIFFVIFFALRPGPAIDGRPAGLAASVSEVFPSAPAEARILLQVPDGGVWVNNFYKNAEGALPENGAVLIKKTEGYSFLYYPAEARFEIALPVWGTDKDRSSAEQSLFGILGAGKNDICRLNIGVSSFDASGGKETSILSFCGSVLK